MLDTAGCLSTRARPEHSFTYVVDNNAKRGSPQSDIAGAIISEAGIGNMWVKESILDGAMQAGIAGITP